ncbi:hypothetical protein HY745_02830 [Candidatus Desantisbacteria bacterium]|nr:hypothetical protein [Candidatus Desantisbacteria bacterium]
MSDQKTIIAIWLTAIFTAMIIYFFLVRFGDQAGEIKRLQVHISRLESTIIEYQKAIPDTMLSAGEMP